MTMEKGKKTTIVTFKAISWDRKIIHKNIPIYHDFEEIPSCKFHGVDLPPITIEQQVINFLDEQDKSELMNKYEFDIILDYYVKKKNPRRKKGWEIKEFMEYCKPIVEANPTFKRPFEAIISESKDTLFGKRKSNAQKLDEVINAYLMTMKSADGALDIALKMMKGENINTNLLEEYNENKNKKELKQ